MCDEYSGYDDDLYDDEGDYLWEWEDDEDDEEDEDESWEWDDEDDEGWSLTPKGDKEDYRDMMDRDLDSGWPYE